MSQIERPKLRLRPNKSPGKIYAGFPWVYNNELVLDRRSRNIPAGTIVNLFDNKSDFLGVAAFNGESRISARILDRDPEAVINQQWLADRISTALAHRTALYSDPFYRLIHAEADGLPGVIVDRFGDVLALQPNGAWADLMLDDLCEALRIVTGAKTIIVNGMGRARKLEGLPEVSHQVGSDFENPIMVPMNGATYAADVVTGQKTGLFFDQRDNHQFLQRLTKDADVLDVFSHVGGFSLAALSAGATHATAVDGSAPALELAQTGAAAAGFSEQFETLKSDAFQAMTQMGEDGRSFGVVICDPPAFAPSKPALTAGLRAYEKVARQGATLVKPGGYLCLCSCSHAASLDAFRTACATGISKAGRSAQLIRTGFAGPDHPMHPQLAESGYLKVLFFKMI